MNDFIVAVARDAPAAYALGVVAAMELTGLAMHCVLEAVPQLLRLLRHLHGK